MVYEERDQGSPAEERELIQRDHAGQRATYDVFLSYAGEDRPIAAELADALRGTGFNVWYDKFQLRVGDRLLERINDGLNNSRYGLLLISPAFLSKPWPSWSNRAEHKRGNSRPRDRTGEGNGGRSGDGCVRP